MGRTTPTIGVFSPFVGGFYFGIMLKAMAEVIRRAGGRLVAVQAVASGATHEGEIEPLMMRHRVAWDHLDGSIVIINSAPPAYLQAFQDTGRPVVMISNEYPDFACATILPDNRGGVREAVQHLIGHGHRRIAFAGHIAQEDIRERYESYVDTLVQAGLEADPALLYETGGHQRSGGQAAARLMLAAGLPSTAVVAATDFNALGLMAELTDAGLRLPEQQAVAGFDGMEIGGYTNPSLTTVEQDFALIGQRAAELVLQQITHGDADRSRRYVATRFVVRESCGCADLVQRTDSPNPADGMPGMHEAVVRVLADVAQPDELAGADTIADVALARGVVASAVVAALTGEEQPGPTALKRALDAIYHLRPVGETSSAIISAVRASAQGVANQLGVPAQLRFGELLVSLGHWLARAQVHHLFQENQTLQNLLFSQYEVSVDLLDSDKTGLYELTFLERTQARAGLLGLWTGETDADGDDVLEVAGCYDRGRTLPSTTGLLCGVDSFPPESLLALVEGTTDIVHVAPAAIGTSDWGLLAMVGPVETAVVSGHEAINQWAALLAVALDARKTLGSLNEQRETLAAALGRESQLVKDFRSSQERYILATRATDGGLWDWDLQTGVVYYANRWKTLAGYSEHEIDDSPEAWLSRVHEDDRLGLVASLDRLIAGEVPSLEHEHRLCRPDGTYRWMFCRAISVIGTQGTAIRLVGSLTDINERKQLEDRLRQAALYDGLTSLPNRTLFLERLGQALEKSRGRRPSEFSVLFMDLDGFKAVNDTLGHLAGDELLIQAAQRIQRILRGTDTAARMGGDEFAVLVEDVYGTEDAELVSRRVQESFAQPFDINGQVVLVTASLGIAHSSQGFVSAEDLLRDADLDMYQTKMARRDKVRSAAR